MKDSAIKDMSYRTLQTMLQQVGIDVHYYLVG